MKQYNTIQYDTWDIISLKVYGSEMYFDKIIKANPQYRDIFEFSANVALNIPEIEAAVAAETLPVWRKVII